MPGPYASLQDIPKFPRAHWQVNVGWEYLETMIADWVRDYNLNLEPDFQRAHVWTEQQQRAYVEYVLRGGEVGRALTFNCPGWTTTLSVGAYEIVDGKQRLEAVRRFMRDELVVFGSRRSEFTGRLRIFHDFEWRVCELDRKGVLELYLNINGGGTPHTRAELDRVRALLLKEE